MLVGGVYLRCNLLRKNYMCVRSQGAATGLCKRIICYAITVYSCLHLNGFSCCCALLLEETVAVCLGCDIAVV